MFKTLKILTVSALVGAGAMTLAPVSAYAGGGEGVYLRFGDRDRHGGEFGLRFGDSGRPHRDWNRRDRGCSEGDAVNKARRMGLHRVRVEDTSRRSITVSGRSGGGREYVTFGRSGGCPVRG